MEVMHVHRKDMQVYKRAGLHHVEFFRERGIVEWGVYECKMRRARGQDIRARSERHTRRMWKEWVVQRGITKKAKWRRGKDRTCARGGTGQEGEGQGEARHSVVCPVGA